MIKYHLLRKLIFLLLIANGLWLTAFPQYWQQQVNYVIDVTLNDKENSLDGFEKIEYFNHSPDSLKYIWFHAWPNAYKNDRTAFSEQLLVNGNTSFYFSGKDEKGYINRLDFKSNNITLSTEDHPLYIDVIKVMLPSPLAPGQKIDISTPFHVKLPYNFSRGGYDGETYQVTQWFPKPAVYDKNGWHAMPYLDQGEFYSEFGNFDVRITTPSNYVVAATGNLQNAEEVNWLVSRDKFNWQPLKEKQKVNGAVKTITKKYPPSAAATKTLRYLQNNIHDFAWFADKRFIVNKDTCRLPSGRVIDVMTYYTPSEKETWKTSVQFAKDALRHYSVQVGEYPYDIASVVQGPPSFGGGMEYPTITVISPTKSLQELDITIAHELGHNWFYGVLATNERDHPWMDEGINSFYEHRYAKEKYRRNNGFERTLFETFAKEKLDQPIETTSENFNETNYDVVAYYKTSEWLRWIEQEVGKENFDKAMQEYFRRWQFKHPQPEDLKKTLEESLGRDLSPEFDLLKTKGTLPNMRRKGTLPIFAFSGDVFMNGPDVNYKNQVVFAPAFGFNNYDKFMVGGLLTNYRLPLNDFRFLAIPLYATGSKTLTGLGRIDYTFHPGKGPRKIDLFVAGSSFSMNKFVDTANQKHFLRFEKLVPGIRFTFREKDPRSTMHRFIQWKTYFIREGSFRFPIDTIVTGPDTSIVTHVNTVNENRVLNQLRIVLENYRALYPFRAEVKAEQGKGFIRLGFTGNYFFNYSSNDGGADIRLFAGKFIYTNRKKADPFLYALSLSAPKGNMDYDYSDYFVGRNDYPLRLDGEKWTLGYQQIMIRDGGLKMNTDIQGNIGNSDDWIAALNASFDIPSQLNPLSALPVKIPLSIFVDIGTAAESWDRESNDDRFLYDAGLQVSMLKKVVNVYFPLLYSTVYKDYLKSDFIGKKKFLRSISFSIDLDRFSLRNIDRHLTF